MSKTYLFAGAASHVAIKCCEILQLEGHRVIGISRNEFKNNYNDFFVVDNYHSASYPYIDEPLAGIVYFSRKHKFKTFC